MSDRPEASAALAKTIDRMIAEIMEAKPMWSEADMTDETLLRNVEVLELGEKAAAMLRAYGFEAVRV